MKILLITNIIPHYRIPLYELLGRHYELTIAHTGKLVNSNSFSEKKLLKTKNGLFIDYKGDLNLNDYNIVIIIFDIKLLNLYRIILKKRKKYKVAVFGIGVSASKKRRYDSSFIIAQICYFILKHVDAGIFYDQYPVVKYSAMGIKPNKLFAAYNTVSATTEHEIKSSEGKNTILFVGSLYKAKGIDVLLNAYYDLLKENKIIDVNLRIVGNGPEYEVIEKWVTEHELTHRIFLEGEITDNEKLSQFFAESFFLVSPNQAGLAIQTALSHGIPVITSNYPYSGGEFSSIIDGVTGFYFDGTVQGLKSKMLEILNSDELDEVYSNCKLFYENFRSPKVWLRGFQNAISYLTSPK